MAERSISTKVAIDGESQYKAALKSIGLEMKELESQMSLTSSKFSESQNSMSALSAKGSTLEQMYQKQSEKLNTLKQALQNAQTAQTKWQNAISQTSSKLSSVDSELQQQNAATEANKAKWEALQNELQQARAKYDAIEKATGSTEEAEKEMGSTIQELEEAEKNLKAAMDQDEKATESLQKQKTQLTSELQSEEKANQTASNAVTKYNTQINNAEKDLNELDAELKKNEQYLNEAKSSIDGCATSIDEYGKETKETSEEAQDFGDSTDDLQTGLNDLQSVLISAGLISAVRELGEAFKACMETSIDFESTMSEVEALSGATGEELSALSDKAEELGANTKFTAAEAAEGFSYMALAGWDAEEMLSGIDGIINLAAAASMDLGEASDIVTDDLTAFGWSASDAGTFVDEMAYAMSSSNTNVSQLGEAYKNVAATAKSMGFSVEDTTAALMVMANSGIKGGEAGNALSVIMQRLATNTKGCADTLKEYGVNVRDEATGELRNLSDILTDMSNAWGTMSSEEQAATSKIVAGTSHYTQLQTIISGCAQSATDGSSDFLAYADALADCGGAASDMATTMQDNLSGSLTKFSSAADGLKNTIGGQLTPAIQDIVDNGTDLVSKINEIIGENEALVPIIAGVTTGLAGMTVGVSALTIATQVYNTLKMSETIMSLVTPIGLASAALGVLVAGVLALEPAENETAKAVEELNEAMDTQASQHAESMQTYSDTAANAEELKNRLFSLSDAYDGSESAAAEMRSVVEQLNQAVPDLNVSFDAETGAINMTADAMEALIEKQKIYDELSEAISNRDAAKQTFEDAGAAVATATDQYNAAVAALEKWNSENEGGSNYDLENQVTTTKSALDSATAAAGRASSAYNNAQMEVNGLKNEFDGVSDSAETASESTTDYAAASEEAAEAAEEEAEAEEKANATLKDIAGELINASGSGDELMETYEDLKKQYDDLDGAGDEWTRNVIEQSLEQLKLEASTKQLSEQLPMLSSSYSGLASAIEAAGYSVDDFVDSYNETLDSLIGGFDTIELDTENSLQAWISAMDQRTSIQTTWNSNMEYLVDCVNNASTHPYLSAQPEMAAAVQELISGGVETYGTAAQDLVTAIQNGDTATVSQILTSIGNASAAAEQAAITEFSQATGVTQSALQTLIDSGAATVVNGEYVITDAAAAMAAGVPEGIAEQSEAAGTSVDTLVEAAGDAFLSDTAVQAYTNGGKALANYTANGITAKASAVSNAARNVVQTAANAARSRAYTSGVSVGTYYDQGVAAGINGHSGSVYSAAYNLGKTIANGTKSAIRSSSPSKVGIEIGGYWDQGVAIGIEKEASIVEDSASSMAESLISATQSVLDADGMTTAMDSYIDACNAKLSVIEDTAELTGNVMDQFSASHETTSAALMRSLQAQVDNIRNLSGDVSVTSKTVSGNFNGSNTGNIAQTVIPSVSIAIYAQPGQDENALADRVAQKITAIIARGA